MRDIQPRNMLDSADTARAARLLVPASALLCFIFMLVTASATVFKTNCELQFGGDAWGETTLWRSCSGSDSPAERQCSKISESDYEVRVASLESLRSLSASPGFQGMRRDTWTALQFGRSFTILSIIALFSIIVFMLLSAARPGIAEVVSVRRQMAATALTGERVSLPPTAGLHHPCPCACLIRAVFLQLVAMAAIARWTDNVRSNASSDCTKFTFGAGGSLVCVILSFLVSAFVMLPAHLIIARKPGGEIRQAQEETAYGSVL